MIELLEEIYIDIIYLILCFLQPICLPLPETATILGGSLTLGASKSLVLGMIGTLSGICLMYTLANYGGKKFQKRFENSSALEKYQYYVQNNAFLITGLLFIVPVLPDEFICLGAGLAGIRFKMFMGIAVISKFISISMVAYSKEIGSLFSVTRKEIIVIELIVLFVAAIVMKRYMKYKKVRVNTSVLG